MKNNEAKPVKAQRSSKQKSCTLGAIAGILKKDGEWTPTEGEQKSPEQPHSPSIAAQQSHTAQQT
jgi:hypothetical protein